MIPFDCDAPHYTCDCGRHVCAEESPSPREDEGVCAECAEADGPAEAMA